MKKTNMTMGSEKMRRTSALNTCQMSSSAVFTLSFLRS